MLHRHKTSGKVTNIQYRANWPLSIFTAHGLACFQCDGVDDPAMCNNTVACAPAEVCINTHAHTHTYARTYTHTHARTHTHTRTHAHTHAVTYTYTSACAYAQTYMFECTNTHKRAHTLAYLNGCTYAYSHTVVWNGEWDRCVVVLHVTVVLLLCVTRHVRKQRTSWMALPSTRWVVRVIWWVTQHYTILFRGNYQFPFDAVVKELYWPY
jgi:hypothetical protein